MTKLGLYYRSLEIFPHLKNSLTTSPKTGSASQSFSDIDSAAWKEIFDSEAPHNTKFPDHWDQLSQFQKLLIIRCLRPDKLLDGIQDFIQQNLGPAFLSSPRWSLENYYKLSSNVLPMVFILSPGANPINDVNKLAEAKGVNKLCNEYLFD